MGMTYAEITVGNPFRQRKLVLTSLVDSGSVFLTLPEHVAVQLGYDTSEVSTREIILADGSRRSVPMVGPLRVHFAGRYCDLSALVVGDEPLFGAVPMEMMDLVLNPATRTLTVNPANPFVPVALAK